MKKMLKFPLHRGYNYVTMEDGSLALKYIDSQYNHFYGWFEYDDTKPYTPQTVYLATTGEQVPSNLTYVTSHQITHNDQYFVLHAYV